jgi:PAS domain S-box-containing protein
LSPEAFCRIADLLPDPLALLSGEGRVLAVNREFVERLNVSADAACGRRLCELAADPPESIDGYLQTASRARARTPGRLCLPGPEGPVQWRCEAGLVAPHADPAERRLMLRLFSPATAAQRFVTLNKQLEQLANEVARRNQMEEELRHEREYLQTTLHSIGDAVIVTDREGRVSAINPAARQLTGWGDEALGAPLASVFNIINEYTRAVTENPVEKVFKQGTVVGLANHTILISKDGGERAIDDSAAPIRDKDGQIVGVVLVFRDVTEQRAAEAELRGSEERLHLALQAGRMGTWEWNVRSGEVHWSPTLEAMHGLEPGAFPGTFEAYQNDIHPEDREYVLGAIQRLLDGEDKHLLEYRIVLPDESIRWVEARGTLFRDEEGRPERLVGVCADVTERKRAEQDLKLQSLVLESMVEGVSVFDERGVIRFTNAAEDRMFGYERGELIGRHLTDKNAYSPEENERFVAQIIETVRRDGFCDRELLKRRKDGTEFLTQSRVTALEMDGRMYWVSVQEDVTERKRAEEQLYESELRFRQLAEHIQDVFYVVAVEDSRTLYVSPAYERTWGRSRQSLYDAPRSFLDAVLPEDRPRIEDAMARNRRGEATSVEYRIRRPDGAQRWIRARAFPIRGQSGRIERICGIAEDMTEWRRSEAILRFLAEASETLSSLVDLKSTLQKVAQFAVPEFADWCAVDLVQDGGAPERVAVAHVDPTKRELAERLHEEYPSDPDSPYGVHEVLRTGKPVMLESIGPELVRTAARDEDHRRLLEELALRSYMCVPLVGRKGVLGVVTFVAAESGRRYTAHDLAVAEDFARRATTAIENAQLYQEVREADRRKDDFLAMLAHELRNPLAPIRSGLDLLRLQGDGQNEVLELMQQQVEHLVRLVDDLLDVSRIMRGRVELRREPVQLAEIVHRAAEALRASIDEQGQQLTLEVPDEPVWLDADSVRLVQVLENLLNNASKYTDVGGQIWLEAQREGDEAVVSVRDNGIGIAADVLPDVFDLFTQASQALDRARGGLGIGLTLVRNLVEMHGGRVSAHSDGPGRGSRFTVRLPVGRPAGASSPGKASGAPPQNRRILIVDDNAGAAQMLALLLSRLGSHETEVVHDGVAALAAAREFLPEVILLDIGLPGKDGYQVARELRAMPRVRDALLVALTG